MHRFDQPSSVLNYRDGEFQIDSINSVEDTKVSRAREPRLRSVGIVFEFGVNLC